MDRLDPRTGTRSLWREMRTPALDGVRLAQAVITPDGTAYAYSYQLTTWNLFLLHAGR